jgi:hypothetical protein
MEKRVGGKRHAELVEASGQAQDTKEEKRSGGNNDRDDEDRMI